MKTLLCLSLSIAALAITTFPSYATVTFLNGYTGTATEVNSSTELAYQADVSNTDLLNGASPSSFTTGTGAGSGIWHSDNGATMPELNDGIHGESRGGKSSNWHRCGSLQEGSLRDC